MGAVATVGLLAAAAGLLVLSGDPVVASAPRPVRSDVGRPIQTSFGVMSVDNVGRLNASGVPVRQVLVEVAVTLTNLRERPIPFARSDFSLRFGRKGNVVDPLNVTLALRRLEARTSRKALVRFVVPRDHARLSFRYRDPGRPSAIIVDVGYATKLARTTNPGQHGKGGDH